MCDQKEMPRYKCHKVVRAAKIVGVISRNDVGGWTLKLEGRRPAVTVTDAWYAKHAPLVGGYYVVYKGGYESFSPADAFEEGYTLVGESYQDRVVQEKKELDERVGRLVAFGQGVGYAGLPLEEQDRLTRQLLVMEDYSTILGERIEAFSDDENKL